MARMGKRTIFDYLLDFIEIFIIGATIFLLVYLFVGQLLEVTGDSMYPTLVDKEQVIAEKLSTRFKPLERGEIIIFRHPEQHTRLLIKRIVGLPGEEIKILNGQVFINDEVLTEPYLQPGTATNGNKMMLDGTGYNIGSYSYILMGDNRSKSSDSRSLGAIREELIVGRAMLVYYPFSSARLIEH